MGQSLYQRFSAIIVGDVIILNAGDMLPADCLILKANELYANESSLTTTALPDFPFSRDIGLTPLPLINLGAMLLIVVVEQMKMF